MKRLAYQVLFTIVIILLLGSAVFAHTPESTPLYKKFYEEAGAGITDPDL